MNQDEIRDYLVGKMAEVLERPSKLPTSYHGPPIPQLIRGNSHYRDHEPGVASLQCGRSVAYFFDLTVAQQQYQQMEEKARRGLLESGALLQGMIERHEASGAEGNIAFLVTMAHRNVLPVTAIPTPSGRCSRVFEAGDQDDS